MNRTNSRVYGDPKETDALITNLFQSLCRADQDDWLLKMGLSRKEEGGRASTATMRGFSNASPVVSAIKCSPGGAVASGTAAAAAEGSVPRSCGGRGPRIDFCSSRICAALRLTGEDHKPADIAAMPHVVDIGRAGAAGKQGHMLGWFSEAAGVSVSSGDGSSSQQPTELPLARARKEWLSQDHMGAPSPAKLFEAQLERFPSAKARGGLTFDEFAAIFSCFEYN